MDFSHIELSDTDRRFAERVRDDVPAIVTAERLAAEQTSGDCISIPIHRDLAARGYLMPHLPAEAGGADLSPLQRRILELELARVRYPWIIADTTAKVWGTVYRYGDPALVAALRPGVAAGELLFCLGYTEPEGGSDVANARLRATRRGNDWVLTGSKTFTTGAHLAHYVFTLARTDPLVPKHRGMTMFLVDLSSPGIMISPLHTYGGERTNTVIFDDVTISDAHRIGDVGDGWSVLRGPLDEEHSVGLTTHGLRNLSIGRTYLYDLEAALDAAVRWLSRHTDDDGRRLIDDPVVLHRLGKIVTDIEAAISAPGPMGRVAGADVTMRGAAELLDLMGGYGLVADHAAWEGAATAARPAAPSGEADDDEALLDFMFRFSFGTAIYGGTLHVFRTIIAGMLGLPRLRLPGSRQFLPSPRAACSEAGT